MTAADGAPAVDERAGDERAGDEGAAAEPCATLSGPGDAGASDPAARTAARQTPVLPDRAAEDTATAWGERDEDDDDRYLRERPPHW